MPVGDQPLKIGDVAARLGTTVRTIRYYEEEGLVVPARSCGGTRLYSAHQIARLRAIGRLLEAGYSIGMVRALAELRPRHATGDASQHAVRAHLADLLASTRAQLDRLESLARQIEATRAAVKKCSGCRNTPSRAGCPDCPVRTRLDDIELLNLIWEGET